MKKVFAIIAALFTAALIALSYKHGFVGDKIIVFSSIFFAVYNGFNNWRELYNILTK